MANYEAHTRTRTVGPRTQHGSDRKEQATSHSKNTTSMYVAMLISVTKASVEIDGAARTNQVGYITVIARLLGIYGNVNRLLVLGLRRALGLGSVYCHKSLAPVL